MSSRQIDGLGENYVSGELERFGWITCIPIRDIGIDRVAFKLTKGNSNTFSFKLKQPDGLLYQDI